MQHRICDMPGCGRKIEGAELAKQPARVKTAIGVVIVSFSFPGTRPDLCNCCLLDAAATLDPRKDSGNVIPMPVKGGSDGRIR